MRTSCSESTFDPNERLDLPTDKMLDLIDFFI